MNRFTRWIKKNILKIPVLTHESAQIAEEREKVASQISDDQIYIQTIKQAMEVEASDYEKLMFAFSGLPETYSDFPSAKLLFIDILEVLEAQDLVTKGEIEKFKQLLKTVNSYDDLMQQAAS